MSESNEDHLAQAERHVREGERRVAEQRGRVAKLAADGYDTTEAEKFLRTLVESLTIMRQHLQIEVSEVNLRPKE